MKSNNFLFPRVADTSQPSSKAEPSLLTSPKFRKAVRPGWRPTIVRAETLKLLRAIQKSMVDPPVDLSYLSEACLQIALELGPEEIMKRALSDVKPHFPKDNF